MGAQITITCDVTSPPHTNTIDNKNDNDRDSDKEKDKLQFYSGH